LYTGSPVEHGVIGSESSPNKLTGTQAFTNILTPSQHGFPEPAKVEAFNA
jgi:hypothetical protein